MAASMVESDEQSNRMTDSDNNKKAGIIAASSDDVEEKDLHEDGEDDGEGSSHVASQEKGQCKRKNRRRGKGKTKKASQQQPDVGSAMTQNLGIPGADGDTLKQHVVRKVAEEQVQQIVQRGFRAACWSLGIVLPQYATPHGSTHSAPFAFDPLPGPTIEAAAAISSSAPVSKNYTQEYHAEPDHLLFGRSGMSGVNWEGTLMSIVDRAAHDPITMESLVQDLALALPEISMEIQHHHQDEYSMSSAGWGEFDGAATDYFHHHQQQQFDSLPPPPPPGFALEPDSMNPSYIDLLLQTQQQSQQPFKHRPYRSKMWGSTSSLASLSLAVASAAVEDEIDHQTIGDVSFLRDDTPEEKEGLLTLHKAWDPDRAARVALVTDLAEEERHRRIAEREEFTWKDRLKRAARIEWAVLASEAERQRKALADSARMEREQRLNRLKQQVLEEHNERRRRSSVTQVTEDQSALSSMASSLLNTSTGSVLSPVAIAETSVASDNATSSILSDDSTASFLPSGDSQQQQQSPSQKESKHAQTPPKSDLPMYVQDYEVICPYSVLGCDATLRRSELIKHFDTCLFRAEVIEAKRLAMLKETYNPLDHVVVCPYTVVGCTFSCRRADLPAHLQVCPAKMERNPTSFLVQQQSMVYEVVCPYTPLGCTVTCLRSQIGFHLQECPHRPRSRQEEDQERESNRQYAIEVEEEERTRRVASPRERLTSMDSKTRGLVLEAIVSNPAPVTSTTKRATTTMKKPSASGPSPLAVAVQNRRRAMSLDKRERSQSVSSNTIPLTTTSGISNSSSISPILPPSSVLLLSPSQQPQSQLPPPPLVIAASHGTPQSTSSPSGGPEASSFTDNEEYARTRRVSWVVQAAEIERMRKAEEKIAIATASSSSGVSELLKTPPTSPNRKGTLQRKVSGDETESPPGRKRIVLEAALRRQRLHHAQWFPAESLDFQGRRTHVYSFHNHMEQQTRLLHRALHEEIERFGRDCALWELSCQASVNELMENIKTVVESTWVKFIATTPPTLHMFGSFASELAVPGVSDLDLVVVPGALPTDSNEKTTTTTTTSDSKAPSSLTRSTSLSGGGATTTMDKTTLTRSASSSTSSTTTTTTASRSTPSSSGIPPIGRRSSISSQQPSQRAHPHHSQQLQQQSPMYMHSKKTLAADSMTPPSPSRSLTENPISLASSSWRLQQSPPRPGPTKSFTRRSGSMDEPVSASNSTHLFPNLHGSSAFNSGHLSRLRSRSIPDASSSDTHMRNLMRDRLEAARRCRILGESLMQCDFLQNVRVIDTASVPVVSMRSNDAAVMPLDIDLTVALSNHDGLAAAEFVKMLRTRFPPLMPMVRLLKAFLHSRGLANPFHGGLPSYALVLMATCSVIRSCDRVGPRQACFLSQGELVVDFLDLFGREFDAKAEAVCCNWKADLDKLGIGRAVSTELPLLYISSRGNSLSGSLPHQQEVTLVVDDPIRFGNNVGRSSFAFAQVQQAFAEVLASLLSHVVKNEALGRSSLINNSSAGGYSLLENVFGVKPLLGLSPPLQSQQQQRQASSSAKPTHLSPSSSDQ